LNTTQTPAGNLKERLVKFEQISSSQGKEFTVYQGKEPLRKNLTEESLTQRIGVTQENYKAVKCNPQTKNFMGHVTKKFSGQGNLSQYSDKRGFSEN